MPFIDIAWIFSLLFTVIVCVYGNSIISLCRYASRCLMVEFMDPPLQITLAKYMEIVELCKACGSCAGFCVSLGKAFFHEGVEDVDERILPEFAASVAGHVSPRVLPSYSVLYWFANQVGHHINCNSFRIIKSKTHPYYGKIDKHLLSKYVLLASRTIQPSLELN